MEVDVKKFAAMFDKLPCVGKCELVTSTFGDSEIQQCGFYLFKRLIGSRGICVVLLVHENLFIEFGTLW
jgi:hypothetical protein